MWIKLSGSETGNTIAPDTSPDPFSRDFQKFENYIFRSTNIYSALDHVCWLFKKLSGSETGNTIAPDTSLGPCSRDSEEFENIYLFGVLHIFSIGSCVLALQKVVWVRDR